MKEGAENVQTKLQAKAESVGLKNLGGDKSGKQLKTLNKKKKKKKKKFLGIF